MFCAFNKTVIPLPCEIDNRLKMTQYLIDNNHFTSDSIPSNILVYCEIRRYIGDTLFRTANGEFLYLKQEILPLYTVIEDVQQYFKPFVKSIAFCDKFISSINQSKFFELFNPIKLPYTEWINSAIEQVPVFIQRSTYQRIKNQFILFLDEFFKNLKDMICANKESMLQFIDGIKHDLVQEQRARRRLADKKYREKIKSNETQDDAEVKMSPEEKEQRQKELRKARNQRYQANKKQKQQQELSEEDKHKLLMDLQEKQQKAMEKLKLKLGIVDE